MGHNTDITRCIACTDTHIDGFVCICNQFTARNTNTPCSSCLYGGRNICAINIDCHRIAYAIVSSHTSTDGHIAAGFCCIQDVISGDVINSNSGTTAIWRCGVNHINLVLGHNTDITRCIACTDTHIDGFVCICNQFTARNTNTPCSSCLYGGRNICAINIDCHRIAYAIVSSHTSTDGHIAAGFCCIQDVIRGDVINSDCGGGTVWGRSINMNNSFSCIYMTKAIVMRNNYSVATISHTYRSNNFLCIYF